MARKLTRRGTVAALLACCVAALLLACCLPAVSSTASFTASGIHIFDSARFVLADDELPPDPAQFPLGQDVTLPDEWATSRPGTTGVGWYRFELQGPVSRAGQRWAVYLPRVDSNAAVFVNGRPLGVLGSSVQAGARNWNRPLYFPLISSELSAPLNTIDIRLETRGSLNAGLDAPLLGPDRELGPVFRARYRRQVTAAQVSTTAGIVMVVLFGVIFLFGVRDRVYGYFALVALAWTSVSLNYHLQFPPLSFWAWKHLIHASLDWFAVFFVFAVSHLVDRSGPRQERALLLFGLAATVAPLLVPRAVFFDVTSAFHAGSLALSAYCLWMVGVSRHRLSTVELVIYAVTGVLLVALVGYDFTVQVGLRPAAGGRVMQFAGALTCVGFAGALLMRFAQTYRLAAAANVELERQVNDKRAELESNYRRLLVLENERVVGVERERIMREMHDGVGSQLVSALVTLEKEGHALGPVSDGLRWALTDMRLVIDSMDPAVDDIPTLLGTLRGRLEPQLLRQGLRFDWRVGELPGAKRLDAAGFLHVLRICQETIANVVAHARAGVIRVETGERVGPDGAAGVYVAISDDGVGGASSASGTAGRGLANMHTRAAALGAELTVADAQPGTTVDLWIPRDPAV